MSQSSNRALAKGSVKLSGFLPGQSYWLSLLLTDTCTLYMMVVLGLGSKTLLAALQGSGLADAAATSGGRLQMLQMQLPRLDTPLRSLVPAALQQQGVSFDVLAVWRCTTGGEQQQQQQALYIQVDGRQGKEAAGTAMLRVYNSTTGLLAVAGPSRAGSAASSRDAAADGAAADGSSIKGLSGVLAIMPLLSSSQGELSWPQGHQVSRVEDVGMWGAFPKRFMACGLKMTFQCFEMGNISKAATCIIAQQCSRGCLTSCSAG